MNLKFSLSGAILNAIFIRKYCQILQISDIMLPKFEGEKIKLKTRGKNSVREALAFFLCPSDVKTKSLVTLIYYRLGYLCNKTHGTVNEVFICTDYRYAIFV